MRVSFNASVDAASDETTWTVGDGLGRRVARAAMPVVTVMVAVMLPGAALASGGCHGGSADVDFDGEITTDLQDCPEGDTGDSGDTAPVSHDPPDGTPMHVRVGSVDAEGELCLGWDTIWADQPYEAYLVLNNEVNSLNTWLIDNGLDDEGLIAELLVGDSGGNDLLPDCEAAESVDPQVVRDMVIHRLPVPSPTTNPDWALTGIPTYLEIGAEVEYDETLTGEALPVDVTVTGQAIYHVDWGDGTTSEHRSAGGPYPDGDVVHTYASASDEDVEVVVTPAWDLEWSAAGVTMPLEVVLEAASYQVPVRELQAVRTTD